MGEIVDWEKFFLELLLELGGLVGIAVCGLKFVCNTFADRISKQYETKLNEKLELYRNTIENRSYVSKVKFDANFAVCCEISEKLSYCFEAIRTITPKDGYGIDKTMEIKEIEEIVDNFKKSIFRNRPVLSSEFYNELSDLVNFFNSQIEAYQAIYEEDNEISFVGQSELELEEKEKEAYALISNYYSSLGVMS